MITHHSSKALVAEIIGTFCLVFAGTGAIIVNDVSGGAITHMGIALTFGLVVMAMIYALGEVSGAHLNPAVTLGFVFAKQFPMRWAIPYVMAQCMGACTASLSLRLLFPQHVGLGATLPHGSPVQSFVLEVILTFFLMFVILSVSTDPPHLSKTQPKLKGVTAGLAIGATVALAALFGGPISGASMNPARSLAPALIGLALTNLWIYLTAPLLGAAIAVLACRAVHPQGCCATPHQGSPQDCS